MLSQFHMQHWKGATQATNVPTPREVLQGCCFIAQVHPQMGSLRSVQCTHRHRLQISCCMGITHCHCFRGTDAGMPCANTPRWLMKPHSRAVLATISSNLSKQIRLCKQRDKYTCKARTTHNEKHGHGPNFRGNK